MKRIRTSAELVDIIDKYLELKNKPVKACSY